MNKPSLRYVMLNQEVANRIYKRLAVAMNVGDPVEIPLYDPKGVAMPSVSKKQQRFMGAELARARAGKKTRTGMSEPQLKDFAKGPVKRGRLAKRQP